MPDRPPLILLPALPCGEEFYAAQTKALGDAVRCEVRVLAEPTLAASAQAVLDAAPPRFLLAGTAYGGALAIEIAVTAPDRIAGLWLMNCSAGPHPDPEAARALSARVRAGGYEAVLAEWAPVIVADGAPAARERFLAMARAAGAARFAAQHDALAGRRDHWAGIARIAAPTLLLWGADDRFIPLAIGHRMAATIPRARLVALPECRHFPPLERPEETIAEARRWLGDALPRGAS